MVSGCEASNGEKALHIGRTWWRSKVSADYLQKSFPHWVWLPRFLLVFFPKPANYTKLGSLIHNCKPQAFVLFKGKPKVVFNGWGYGSISWCTTFNWLEVSPPWTRRPPSWRHCSSGWKCRGWDGRRKIWKGFFILHHLFVSIHFNYNSCGEPSFKTYFFLHLTICLFSIRLK